MFTDTLRHHKQTGQQPVFTANTRADRCQSDTEQVFRFTSRIHICKRIDRPDNQYEQFTTQLAFIKSSLRSEYTGCPVSCSLFMFLRLKTELQWNCQSFEIVLSINNVHASPVRRKCHRSGGVQCICRVYSVHHWRNVHGEKS